MERALGSFERAAWRTGERSPLVAVVALRLSGELRRDRLRGALDRLQAEVPLLAVHVDPAAGEPRFITRGTPAIPVVVPTRRGDEHWLAEVEDELNRPFASAVGPLLRCRLLDGGDAGGGHAGGDRREPRHDLILAFHHAIVDAASLGPLLDRLLTLLAGDTGDTGHTGQHATASAPADRPAPEPAARETPAPAVPDTAVPATAAPAPVEPRLPRGVRGLRGRLRMAGFVARQLADELLFRLRRRGGRRPPVVAAARCRPLPLALGSAETAALVAATRRRRITVNSALSAAMLLAVHRHLYDGRPRPLRYIAFADLRPYLDPPLAADELGAAISMLRHTLRLPAGAGFWPVAAAITRQVDRGNRRGDKFCSYRLCEAMMRATLRQDRERMAATAVSYSGVMTLPEPRTEARTDPGRASPRLSVRSCHAFVSNLAVGPEYTAQARMLDGRLLLDVVYLDSDLDPERARAIGADVLDTLRRAGGMEGGAR